MSEKTDPSRLPQALIIVITILFVGLIGIRSLTHHRIGDYGIETDFYWDYAPAAVELSQGIFNPEHYRFRGPGYPLLLVPWEILGVDVFTAARLTAVLSAGLILIVAGDIWRRLISPWWSAVGVALLSSNLLFTEYAWRTGTDMPFAAVCAVFYLLLTYEDFRGRPFFIGTTAGFSFLIRYNGAANIIVAVLGASIQILTRGRTGLRRAGMTAAGVALFLVPWMIVLNLSTGSAFYNFNHLNLKYILSPLSSQPMGWERFWYGGEGDSSFAMQSILRVFLTNITSHLNLDLDRLMGWESGWTVLPGLALTLMTPTIRRRLGWLLIVGLGHYLILASVFYRSRFGLPILVIYYTLSLTFFASSLVRRWLAWLPKPTLGAALIALIPAAISLPCNAVEICRKMETGPHEITELTSTREVQSLVQGRMAARKPHAAFIMGHQFVPLPQLRNLDETVNWMASRQVDYLFVNRREAALRPFLIGLLREPFKNENLVPIKLIDHPSPAGVWCLAKGKN